jgi:type I restriction enzyme S subunit
VRGTTGSLAIASHELKGANVTRGIVPVRFSEKLIDPEFGFYMLTSRLVQDQIRSATYGAALMQINISDVRKLTVR